MTDVSGRRALFLAATTVALLLAVGVAFSGSAAAGIDSIGEGINADNVSADQDSTAQEVELQAVSGDGDDEIIVSPSRGTISDVSVEDSGSFNFSDSSDVFVPEGGNQFELVVTADSNRTSDITVEVTLNTSGVDSGAAEYTANTEGGASASGDFQIQSSSDSTTPSPTVDTDASSITPAETTTDETQEYTVDVTIDNVPNEAATVDIVIDDFVIFEDGNSEDDASIDYGAEAVNNGTASFNATFNATATSMAGSSGVAVSEIRLEDGNEPIYEDFAIIDSINVQDAPSDGTLTVNNDGSADYESIQNAVDNASEGATIEVEPGVYSEQVIIENTSDITVTGINTPDIEAPDRGNIDAVGNVGDRQAKAPFAILNSSDISINNLRVNGRNQGTGGGAYVGVYAEDTSVSVSDVIITNTTQGPDGAPSGNQFNEGLRISTTDGADRSATLNNVTVRNFDKRGIRAQASEAGDLSVEVTGSTVVGAGGTNATAQNGLSLVNVSGTFSDNTVRDISYTGEQGVYAGVVSPVNGVSDVTFRGNELSGAGNPDGKSAVFLYNLNDVSFENNNVTDLRIGVDQFGSEDVTIEGNNFRNNTIQYHNWDPDTTDARTVFEQNTFDTAAHVINDSQHVYSGPQDAISGAPLPLIPSATGSEEGDTVEVGPGTYSENVEIDTANVTVTGQRSNTTIEGLVFLDAEQTELRAIRVNPPTFESGESNNENQAVLVSANDATVDDAIIDIDVAISQEDEFEEIQAVQVFASDNRPISDVTISDNTIIGDGTQSNGSLVGVVGVNDQGNTTETLIVNNDIDVTSQGYSFGVVTRASGGSNAVGTPSSQVAFNNITATGGTFNGVGYGIESTSNPGAESNGAQVDAEAQFVRYNNFEDIDSIEHKAASGTLDLTVNNWEDPGEVQFLTDAFDSEIQDGGQIVYDPVLTEEKSVSNLDELLVEEDGQITATTSDYGSYIELEVTDGATLIGFPAPSEDSLGELLDEDIVEAEDGSAIQAFVYDNADGEFESIDGSFTPTAGEVIAITTEDGLSDEFVVPVETDPAAGVNNPGQTQLGLGYNLVAGGAANDVDEFGVVTSDPGNPIIEADVFQTQARQPGAPEATFGAYSGTWILTSDGTLSTGYNPNTPPSVYFEEVLVPAEDNEAETPN